MSHDGGPSPMYWVIWMVFRISRIFQFFQVQHGVPVLPSDACKVVFPVFRGLSVLSPLVILCW